MSACISRNRMADFYPTNRKSKENGGGVLQVEPATIKRQHYQEEAMGSPSESALQQLRDHVLLMGGEVERAIDQATRALIERDSDLAEQVLRDDDLVDGLELEADQRCVRLLSLQSSQSLGERDLR